MSGDVIEASSVRVSPLVDGSLRIVCEVEPRFAVAAFTLFGSPGVPMALAALQKSQESPKKALGGPLSQWLAIRCGEKAFQAWIGADSADHAAQIVRDHLGIESRAEIDNDDAVRLLFEERIRGPWSKYYASMT